MPNQEESRDGKPRKDKTRPSPDVQRHATDGQADAHGSARQRDDPSQPGGIYEGDGPAKVGLGSDRQQGLVSPSGVNERDHGAADDKPMGGGSLNFDDDTEEHPRGNTARTGGTWDAQGGDSGKIGRAPGPGLSDSNGPSDPDKRNDHLAK